MSPGGNKGLAHPHLIQRLTGHWVCLAILVPEAFVGAASQDPSDGSVTHGV